MKLLGWLCKATGGHEFMVLDFHSHIGTMRCWKCREVRMFDMDRGWPPMPKDKTPPMPPIRPKPKTFIKAG